MRGGVPMITHKWAAAASAPPHQSLSETSFPKGRPLYKESLTIPGQALFVYPYFNFTLLWYTPSAITAVMTSVTQKAFQIPFAPSTRQNAQASGMMTIT